MDSTPKTESPASGGPFAGPPARGSATSSELDLSNHRIDVEKLGRQRPAAFTSRWSEFAFCFSILGSMLMGEFFVSGFVIVLPDVTKHIHMPPGTQTWPASVFSVVTGSFLFPFGRLADMYGGRIVYFAGLVWFFIWSLVAGFSNDHIVLIVSRAMAGFGPAAFLPAGVMLLGSTYRPGPRKNRVFSFYGSCAPLGFFLGIMVGGVVAETLSWRWYFWLGSMILFLIIVATAFAIPPKKEEPGETEDGKPVRMDWLGFSAIVPGLVLVITAVTQGAHAPQGFATPYVYVILIIGVLLLAAAFYIEGWVAEQPLFPFELFKPKSMKPMVFCLFNIYGAFGIYQFYASFYIQDIIGGSALQAAVWFIPMAAGGCILALVGAVVLHRLPGHLLMVLAGMGSLASTLLLALIQKDASYWAFVFPAMIGATLGVDIAYNVSAVFMTTKLPRKMQGLAGALINSLVFLGIGFYLGLADLLVETVAHGNSEWGFQVAFFLGVGCSASALVTGALFTRLGRAKSDLTIEEKLELEEEARRLAEGGEEPRRLSTALGRRPSAVVY